MRRKQFTEREQLLLAGRCESVILDAADEALYKLGGRQTNRSLPSLRSSSSSLSSDTSARSDELVEPAVGMDKSMLDGFCWLDDDELDLSLDDYHLHMAETALSATQSSSRPPSRRPSFRRTLSLGSIPFGQEPNPLTFGLSGPPHQFSANTFLNSPSQTSSEKTKSRVDSTAPVSIQSFRGSFDQSATHYQDPEARLKLRVYLASPQKFDEAVEFGFPSLQDYTRPSSRRPSESQSRNKSSSADAQTFYNDDNTSLFKDLEDVEEANLSNTKIQDTALGFAFQNILKLPTQKSSPIEPEKPRFRPQAWHTRSEPYAHTLAGNREMTLRMTLTRKDLRADESVLYPKGPDPLALAELPPSADGEDIWAKPTRNRGMVMKLWRRVSGKVQ